MCIIDLVPLTGCFFKGFKLLKNQNFPLRYSAVVEARHYDWFFEHMLDCVVEDVQSGCLTVPGFAIPESTPPASHMEEKPSPPPMKRLVVQKA